MLWQPSVPPAAHLQVCWVQTQGAHTSEAWQSVRDYCEIRCHTLRTTWEILLLWPMCLLTRSPGISFYRPFSSNFLSIKRWPDFYTSIDFDVNCWCLARCVIWVYIVWASKFTELLWSSFPFPVCSIKSLLWTQKVISRISLRFILLYYAFPARQCSLGLSQNCFVVLPINAYMKPSSSTEIIKWKPVLKFNSRDVYLLFFPL